MGSTFLTSLFIKCDAGHLVVSVIYLYSETRTHCAFAVGGIGVCDS